MEGIFSHVIRWGYFVEPPNADRDGLMFKSLLIPTAEIIEEETTTTWPST